MTQSKNGRSSLRLSDEELEYYADLYIQYGIREAGVEFEGFLNNPEYYLRKHAPEHEAAAGQDGRGWAKSLRSYLRIRQRSGTSSG
jgi:hypothetical protein